MKKLLFAIIILLGSLFGQPFVDAISVSSYQVSQVSVSSVGSDGTIFMGQKAPLAQFRLQNRGDKHLAFEYVELKNYGNADLTESFADWEILVNGQAVNTWVWTERKKIALMLPEPVIIGRGNTIKIELHAQLVWARKNRNVQLGLRRAEDIDLREINTDAYAEIVTDTNIKFAEQQLRPGGITFRRQSRRTYRR